MKVVHADYGNSWRGGQQQLLLLARGLVQAGIEQTIVAPSLELRKIYESSGLRCLAPGAQALRQACQADVIHAHDGRAHSWMVATCALNRAALVLTRRVSFDIHGRISHFLYRRLDRVICVSNAVRDKVLKTGVDPQRLCVIHDAIDEASLPDELTSRQQIRRALGISAEAFCVTCVSALSAEKGVDVLIAALAQLPGTIGLLSEEGEERAVIQELVVTAGIAGRTKFAQLQPAAKSVVDANPQAITAPALVAAGDVFVLPSRHEGLGSSILMAWALGRPVVATAVGGIPELVEEGITGRLVPAGSANALASAIARIRQQPALGGAMVQRAKRAVGKFSVAEAVGRTFGEYERAIAIKRSL